MRQQYREIRLAMDTVKLIDKMNAIIESYQAQGFVLTLRQLYYQLVARDIVPNTEKSYKNVGEAANKARISGRMDWDAIEDRTRTVVTRNRWLNAAEVVRASAEQFHMDLWDNQPYRLFVVVEKEALAGVMQRPCYWHDIPMLAARGYPSVTVMRDMAIEQLAAAISHGQTPVLLHLGDHDPSGIDMSRDLEERLRMFIEGQNEDPDELIFKRIALNMDQIKAKKPPPNPAKSTDARFQSYRKLFGDQSWELDALEPAYLSQLIADEVANYADPDELEKRKKLIDRSKTKLLKLAANFKD